MVILLRFWPIFFPKMDPRVSPPWFDTITVTSIYSRKIDDHWVVENSNFGDGNFLSFWAMFWTQWDPIGHKMDPRGPHRDLAP